MTPRERTDTLKLWVSWLADGGEYLLRSHELGYWKRAESDLPHECAAMTGEERELLAEAIHIANGAECRLCHGHVEVAA